MGSKKIALTVTLSVCAIAQTVCAAPADPPLATGMSAEELARVFALEGPERGLETWHGMALPVARKYLEAIKNGDCEEAALMQAVEPDKAAQAEKTLEKISELTKWGKWRGDAGWPITTPAGEPGFVYRIKIVTGDAYYNAMLGVALRNGNVVVTSPFLPDGMWSEEARVPTIPDPERFAVGPIGE